MRLRRKRQGIEWRASARWVGYKIMTLIAGFHSYGTPVLIGDLLTSSDVGPFGKQKKILLISNNFALAWTGHLVAAAAVIRSLQSSLSPDKTTLESVIEVLTDPATSQLGRTEVKLICWVIDAHGQHWFLWNSLYPRELFSGAPQCDGSGELTARALVGAKGLHHSSPPEHVDPHEVTRGVLGVTTQLMAYEFWGPSTKPWGFGFAYEILQLVDGTHFKYLDNALFIPIACDLDERGRYLRFRFCASQIKYKADGNCSTFYIHDPIKKTEDIYIVPPPGPDPVEADGVTEDLRQRILNKTYSYPLESDYYCFSLRLRSPVFETSRAFTIIRKDETQLGGLLKINIVGKAFELEISREMVEWFYDNIRADVARSGSPQDSQQT
jgi:hypothetical protein